MWECHPVRIWQERQYITRCSCEDWCALVTLGRLVNWIIEGLEEFYSNSRDAEVIVYWVEFPDRDWMEKEEAGVAGLRKWVLESTTIRNFPRWKCVLISEWYIRLDFVSIRKRLPGWGRWFLTCHMLGTWWEDAAGVQNMQESVFWKPAGKIPFAEV